MKKYILIGIAVGCLMHPILGICSKTGKSDERSQSDLIKHHDRISQFHREISNCLKTGQSASECQNHLEQDCIHHRRAYCPRWSENQKEDQIRTHGMNGRVIRD